MFAFLIGWNSLNCFNRSVLIRAYCTGRYPRNQLYFRLSPLGNPSISMIPLLDQWVKEGNKVRAQGFRFMIRDLRRRKRYQHALEISEWMSGRGLCPFLPADCAIQLDLIGRVHGVDAAERYFHQLSNVEKVDKTYGALLNCYVREGLVEKSLSHMQKMKEIGFASCSLNYNAIMCLYTHMGQLEKIPGVFSEMKENGVSPDSFTYRICMNSYGARSDIDSMEKLLNEMENRPNIVMDWTTYCIVANSYIKAGLRDKAFIFLKKIEERVNKNALGYNYLISFHATLGEKHELMRLWALQKVACKKLANRDYITILGSLVKLGDLEEAEALLGEWESSCHFYDFRVPNTVLIGYCQNGLIEKAQAMLQDIIKKGKTPIPNSWAIIAAAYADKQNMEKAFECMKEALAVQAENPGWRPKPRAISSILKWLVDECPSELDCFMNSLMKVRSVSGELYQDLIEASLQGGKEVH